MSYLDAAAERIQHRADALFKINEFINNADILLQDLTDAERPGDTNPAKNMVEASLTVLRGARENLRTDSAYDVQQIASLLVRDEIAPLARESVSPVIFVTSNRYYPALRSFSACEVVWDCDAIDIQADLFALLVEAVENQCANQGIFLGQPEYDNALYAVDMRRWEYIGEDFEGGDSLNDEWRSL